MLRACSHAPGSLSVTRHEFGYTGTSADMAVVRLRYPLVEVDAVVAAVTIHMCLASTKTRYAVLHPYQVTTTIGISNIIAHKPVFGSMTMRFAIKPSKSLVSSIALLPLYCCTSYCYNCEMQSPLTTSSDRVDTRFCL